MAADRGRDLKVSILSDADRFDVDEPARDLEKLADAADDAGRRLQDLDDDTTRTGRALRNLGDDTEKSERAVKGLADEAKDTAKRVDDSFDKIARASRAAARKVDDDMDRMGDSFDDAKGEIGGTAREAAASFSGGMDDIADAGQEAAVNVAAAFGPAGVVAGVVAAGGIAMLRNDAEKLKEEVSALVEEMIEAGGAISDAFIDNKLEEWAKDGTLLAIKEQAADLDIAFVDLARAKAGDAEATERVVARMGELAEGLDGTVQAHGPAAQAALDLQTRLNELGGELAMNREAQRLAKQAIEGLGEASSGTSGRVSKATQVMGGAWDDLSGKMSRPIRGRVEVAAPTAAEIAATRATIQSYFMRNPVTVNVNPKPGSGQGYGVVRARP